MNEGQAPTGWLRILIPTPEFDSFYNSLPDKVKVKFDYVFNVITSIYNISTKFIKHLNNTDLYEMRVSVGTNEYRTILFAIDRDNLLEAKQIILLNGFIKKSNKDYKRQIEIATKILERFKL
ncbi:MAG: type II toxin-antitoxin system RelE/ParE family toxin [Muribaculaceae bacterium]|nr:addiction module toxin RelE [Bacteroides sp.]MDE6262765.1 type II toxin-antitoxin system RelE/ParE family toxin [Muribaculaceae bacterium]